VRKQKSQNASVGLLGTRPALVLYSVLIVLPCAVFGGLHWHQLSADHKSQLSEVPSAARSAAQRLLAGIEDRLQDLLAKEQARPFYSYQPDFYEDSVTGDIPFSKSGLIADKAPEGIVTWFAYDYLDGPDAEIQFFDGHAETEHWRQERSTMSRFLSRRLVESSFNRRLELQWTRADIADTDTMSIRQVAINRSPLPRNTNCLRDDVALLSDGSDEVEVSHGRFVLLLLRDEIGTPRIVAHRTVEIDAYPDPNALPDCFEALAIDTILVQGFFLDPTWLLDTLPTAVANQVLDESQSLLLAGHADDAVAPGDEVASLNLFDAFDFQVGYGESVETGTIKVAINTSELKARFRAQAWRFLGVAGMMIVSLVFGMGLLVRSVRTSIEHADRTENFVAAVTHELRTPIAAVKMYGEMLRDGWISDESKRQDYHERIVRESNRLDALVDRVLQKRRLAAETTVPEPTDLNEIVRTQMPGLTLSAGTYGNDVAFELEEGLPLVLADIEALHSILVNLVENARKYAPVSRQQLEQGAEPIKVLTRLARGKVLLEVLDRGTGIPEDQKSRVFDAFYRIGDERTRRTRGTGLGLHLVMLQVQAMRGRVQALSRSGGGTIFRITFKTLKKMPKA
jgi:signal transduction histidine kinase